MDRQAVEELNADLAEFTDDVFAYLAYAGQRGYGRQYLRGLMLDGRRKSVEPMAERLGIPRKNLGHFVAQSAWDYCEVMRRVTARADRLLPRRTLLVQWKRKRGGDVFRSWITDLPADTPLAVLVRNSGWSHIRRCPWLRMRPTRTGRWRCCPRGWRCRTGR
jgi:hypothetical protein